MNSDFLYQGLIHAGYRVFEEDDLTWTMAMHEDDEPLVIPKGIDNLVEEVIQYAVQHARVNKVHTPLTTFLGVPATTPPPPQFIPVDLVGSSAKN